MLFFSQILLSLQICGPSLDTPHMTSAPFPHLPGWPWRLVCCAPRDLEQDGACLRRCVGSGVTELLLGGSLSALQPLLAQSSGCRAPVHKRGLAALAFPPHPPAQGLSLGQSLESEALKTLRHTQGTCCRGMRGNGKRRRP